MDHHKRLALWVKIPAGDILKYFSFKIVSNGKSPHMHTLVLTR